MPRRRRDSARVIVLDERGDVLLVRVVDSADDKPPVWITPGGGIEPGETLADAAARELREETGLEVSAADLGAARSSHPGRVGVQRRAALLRRLVLYSPHQLVRAGLAGQEELEADIHDSWRWWAVDDLEIATEMVLPGGLMSLLRSASESSPPADVAELPWVVP